MLSWIIAIPIYSYVYGWEGNLIETAWTIWNSKIRYLGVGSMVVGGIWSLIKLAKPLAKGIFSSLKTYSKIKNNTDTLDERPSKEKDFPINYVFYRSFSRFILD